MTPADIFALVRALRVAVSDDEAKELIIAALDHGLPPIEAARALHDWRELRAASVVTIEGVFS